MRGARSGRCRLNVLDVHWLEQTQADVPAGDEWLSASEVRCQSGLHIAKRRADWRLGRWTAKLAVAARLRMSCRVAALETIAIQAAPDGAPEVVLENRWANVTISLSHRAGFAICAVALTSAVLGCDLEVVESRDDAFVDDYFTSEEKEVLAQASAGDRFRLLALYWSGKESALKSLRAGLRLDTRCLTVSLADDTDLGGLAGWHPLRVRSCNGQVFSGWWQNAGALVRTLIVDPPSAPPIRLKICE